MIARWQVTQTLASFLSMYISLLFRLQQAAQNTWPDTHHKNICFDKKQSILKMIHNKWDIIKQWKESIWTRPAMTHEPVLRMRTWSRTHLSSVRLNHFAPQLHLIFTEFFSVVLSSPYLWKCHQRCSSLSPREIKTLFQQSCSYLWVLHRQTFIPEGIWQLHRFRAARQLPILPWNSALSL